ncbi:MULTISPECIES: FHA domain-containing protein [Anaeromyxobacter]|uniref:FHA domain-containing protein n=1 Tax=Anaeromyxobacter TaxID=161492 RepID=UPI001F58EEE6|nr:MULTISPECIES: FHA domain-containing protein [unclassified Anaeromyxobacter]
MEAAGRKFGAGGAALSEIVVMNGVCAGTVFVLPDIPTVLGRSPESHLQIGDPWISSMHAMFERRGEEVWVIDLESRNGTFVGEERVGEARLDDGAVVRFGRTEIRFTARAGRGAPARTPREERIRPDAQRDTIRSEGTISARVLAAREPVAHEPAVDPHTLAVRPVVVLRMSLHAVRIASSPDVAGRVRAAVDAAARAALNEGAMVGRLASVGVLALFGVTSPRADDAARAVQAARTARGAVRRLGGIDLRAAVDAGPLLAGNAMGPTGADIAALGAAADRCERLAALALPGEILLGPGAAGAAGEGVTQRELDGAAVEVVRDD